MGERPRIAIAGSGTAGLACATRLAREADVTVFERLPVAGGEHCASPAVAALAAAAQAAGARVAAGTTALRWEGDRLLAVGEAGGVVAADILVVATGHRPMTRAEMSIDGARCGGVIPATVALHLLRHGVRLGARVVVAGDGPWAREVALAAAASGAETVVVGTNGWQPEDAERLHLLGEVRITRVLGRPRIEAVELGGTPAGRVDCDALILAAGGVPYRNVDGAVLDDAPGVIFCQARWGRSWAPEAAGLAAAERALAAATADPTPYRPVTTRIGPPA